MEGNGNNECVKVEQLGKGYIKKYETYFKSLTEEKRKHCLRV